MSPTEPGTPAKPRRIVVRKNGSYVVQGDIPLVKKTQVVSEHGEPLTWAKEGEIPTEGNYILCRCGGSSTKPFCDSSHKKSGFDGTETADSGLRESRTERFPSDARIAVKKDRSLCIQSGFCGMVGAGMSQLAAGTANTMTRSLVIAMVERCPSGALTYRIEPEGADNEPDLPQQIAVVTEITSEGPIEGPLWVTGGIPIERSDGQPFETRNRITLCRCGHSKSKPLCDGTHRSIKPGQ